MTRIMRNHMGSVSRLMPVRPLYTTSFGPLYTAAWRHRI